MNKQELQEMVADLQRKSEEHEAVLTDTEHEGNTGDQKEFVNLCNRINGEYTDPESAVIVSSECPVFGFVDYEGLLRHFGLKNEEIKHLWVDIGTRRPYAVEETDTFSVFSLDGKVRVNDTDTDKTARPEQYDIRIDLKRIYDVTGSADFKMYANDGRYINFAFWIKKYSFEYKVIDFKLKTQPQKLRYLCGESFDRTGLVAEITYFNGIVKESTDFHVFPNEFRSDDTLVQIGVDDCVVVYDVIVDTLDGWGEEQIEHVRKEMTLGEKTKAYLDLYDGNVTTVFTALSEDAFSIPLNICHVHNVGFGENVYGKNWRLNLDRKLKLAESDSPQNTIYTYIDETGIEKTFFETYYYTDESGNLQFVDKDSIEVDLQGNLTYNNNIVRKYQTCGEYTLIPELNDFIHSELIEQRQSEQVELEEFVNTYETSLKSYVKAKASSGEIVKHFNNLSENNFNQFISDVNSASSYIILPENEALQLQNLYLSRLQNDVQDGQLKLQMDSLQDTIYIRSTIDPEFCKEEFLCSEAVLNLGNTDLESSPLQMTEITYRRFKEYVSAVNNLSLLDSGGIWVNDHQGQALKKQMNYIVSQARKNLSSFKNAYYKYLRKRTELERLERQTPIAYLRDKNGLISGFNKNGNLVCLLNAYGNYVVIDYDNFNNIVAVYDEKETKITFEYDSNRLTKITDSSGRVVSYMCALDGSLTVTFADNTRIRLFYDGEKINEVYSSNQYKGFWDTNFTFDESGKVIKAITNLLSNKEDVISEINIAYFDNKTVVTDLEQNSEDYRFYTNGKLRKYIATNNAGVETVTETGYLDSGNGKKMMTTTKSDNISDVKESKLKTLNYFDLVISEESFRQKGSALQEKISKTIYTYDSESRLSFEITENYKKINNKIVTIISRKNFYYNAQGQLIFTESYIQGEEETAGKTICETEYDEKGNAVQTISWNSLDSSTKFYSENAYTEYGQISAKKDETGETTETYEYVDGTNIVRAVNYANGSNLVYGRDPHNFNVTSLTQSTDEGVGNTTDTIYQNKLPVEIKSGSTVLKYDYDYKERITSVTLNGLLQTAFEYEDYIFDEETGNCLYGQTKQTLYVNDGETITVVTSKIGVSEEGSTRKYITETSTIGESSIIINYDSHGRIGKITDSEAGETSYTYDDKDRIAAVQSATISEEYEYDDYDNIQQKTLTVEDFTQTYKYTYRNNAARSLEGVETDGIKFYPQTDVNGRNTGKEVYNAGVKVAGEYITYRKVGDHGTNMPSAMWYASGARINENVRYCYDKSGNIAEIRENGEMTARYTYDALNRLVREDNKTFGKTVTVEYDGNGNILSKKKYAFTLSEQEKLEEKENEKAVYLYEGDRLVSYNGESCAYNRIGSPETYRGKAATWQYGKLLASYNGTEFAYDMQGRRVRKGEVEYTYDAEGRLIKQSDGIAYIYDHAGMAGIQYNGVKYLYRKDAQGNVTALLDSDGVVVVKYGYDAWGGQKIEVVNADCAEIAEKNPIRYRGYYYDNETGFYYLQTRYYDPETGRFISQDGLEYADPETINGLNLYAYCGNNPVMYVDPTGTFVLSLLLAAIIGGAIAGAIVGGFYGGATAMATGGNVGWGIFIGIFAGALMGATAGAGGYLIGAALGGVGVLSLSVGATLGLGLGISAGGGLLGGFVADVCIQVANNGRVTDWASPFISAVQWGILNTLSGLSGSIATGFLENIVIALGMGFVLSGLGMASDLIRELIKKSKYKNKSAVGAYKLNYAI